MSYQVRQIQLGCESFPVYPTTVDRTQVNGCVTTHLCHTFFFKGSIIQPLHFTRTIPSMFLQVQHPIPGGDPPRCQPLPLCPAVFIRPLDSGTRPPSPAGCLEHCMAFWVERSLWVTWQLCRRYWVRTSMFFTLMQGVDFLLLLESILICSCRNL